MFESKLAVILKPQLLNKFEESKTTTEMVEKAIEKGYELSNRTPDFLFKYEAIVDLLLKSNDNFQYFVNHLETLMTCETRRKELTLYYANNFNKLNRRLPAHYFVDYIEPDPKYAKFLQFILGLDYLRKNPDYVYSEDFDLDNYAYLDEELYEYLDEIDYDFTRLQKSMEKYNLIPLIKRFPRAIKAKAFESELQRYDCQKVIAELVNEGIIGYDDIPESLIDHDMLATLIINDPKLLDRFPEYAKQISNGWGGNPVINKFIERLPDSLDGLEALSFAYWIGEEHEQKIIDAIIDSGFLITDCNWRFIYDNRELMMDQIRKNPNVLNTCTRLFSDSYSIDDSMFEEIQSVIEKSGVTIYTMHSWYTRNIEFMKFLLKNNPDILKNAGKDLVGTFSYGNKELSELNDGPITPASTGYGEEFDRDIMEAIRMNPHNYLALFGVYDHKEYAFDAYLAALEGGYDVQKTFTNITVPNHELDYIERLRSNEEYIKRCLDTYDRNHPDYPLYYVANHPELIEIKNPRDTFYIVNNPGEASSFNITVDELNPDFSNYYRLNKNLSEEELMQICDMYYANKDNILLSDAELEKNPYIFINELLINDRYLRYSNIDLNEAQIEYFNKRFKELNCVVTDKNSYYVRDFDLILNALSNNIKIKYVNLDWMSSEEQDKFNELLKSKVIDGTICLKDLPRNFIFNNYELLKQYYDVKSIFDEIRYEIDNDKYNDYLIDAINNHVSDFYLDSLENLDDDILRELFRKNLPLLSDMKRRAARLDIEMSDRIRELLDEFDYVELDYDIKEPLSREQLDEIIKYNPTNTGILRYYYSKNLISEELYKEYYLKCLDNVKLGFAFSEIEFDNKLNLAIDNELLEFLKQYDGKKCIEYLKSYYVNEHDFVVKYLLDNYEVFRDFKNIAEFLSFDEIINIIKLHPQFLDKELFKLIFKKISNNPYYANNLYELWKMAGCPTDNVEYLEDVNIARDIINSDNFAYASYDGAIRNPLVDQMVYQFYKDKGNLDVTSSVLFYRNPLILLDCVGRVIPNPPPIDLSREERLEIYLEIAKDKPAFYERFGTAFDREIRNLIKQDPVKMMNLLHYPNRYYIDVLNALKEIGYEFNENTPSIYLKDDAILLDLLQKDNDKIFFVIEIMEKNNLTGKELKDYISKIIVERGIEGYSKYVSPLDLNDYLIECINKDFSVINRLDNVKLDMNVLKHIFTIAVDKIKNGEYIVDENTPKFLFYSNEIRAIVRQTNPELLDGFALERIDRARDYSLIEYAIEHPDNVDELFTGIDRNYPAELVNQLVDKLIDNNYQLSDKTPKFLLCNGKFIYHLLKNNINVEDKYLHNFVTFENYYQFKDKELFTELIGKGYGREFNNYILKYGLETTLELASTYGYLLNVINLSKVRTIEDIPILLVNDDTALETFDRVEDLDKFLDMCERREVRSYSYSRALMKNYLKDINANRDKIIALIKHGFSVYNEGSIGDMFYTNPELIDLYVTYCKYPNHVMHIIDKSDPSLVTPELMMKAIKNGYEINENTPEFIRTNPHYVYEIMSGSDLNKTTRMLHIFKDIALTNEIIDKLLSHGYEVNEKTPDFLLTNMEFLVPYFDRCNYSNSYRNGINCLSAETCKELLQLIDVKKMTLYFKELIPSEQYEEFVMNFVNIADGKRDILHKMIVDGKRLASGIRTSYEKYIVDHFNTIKFEDMDKVLNCLYRIEQSNSGEIRQFANTLVEEVLKLEDYETAFNKVEEIFLQDYLPMVTKLFLVFKVLHKDYASFENTSKLSVVLKNSTNAERDAIIYRDLLNAAFRSNNRSLLEYLNDLSDACSVLEQYERDKDSVSIDKLNKALLFLIAIVNSSYVKNHDDRVVKLTNNHEALITMLKEQFKGYGNLKDAIVQNLFDFPTYDDAVRYIKENAINVDKRNRERANGEFVLEPGDYVKGIGDAVYLTNILQNGSVSKEFLGESAGSDMTPLDTDLCRINVAGNTVGDTIASTAASSYGTIYFVLKGGDRFSITRTKGGEEATDLRELDKLESFHTAVWDGNTSDHYGIRTGFASSEIDFIVAEDPKVQLEVVLNGFYIPIVNRKGELIFTPEDYDKLRAKMSGIEYYGSGPYQIASYEDLMSPGVLEHANGVSENRVSIRLKHNAIKASIKKGMSTVGVTMKDKLDGNVMAGYADLIDTGSTARGTDLPGKADFDYICRVDRNLINDPVKFAEFKEALISQFISIDKEEYVGNNGNFRFKGVMVEGLEEKVDIDISFVIRTTKLNISSDESLLTRMDCIESGNYTVDGDRKIEDPVEARNLVTGNILMAKELLKAYKCYKKHNSPEKQGGLGGIGIENWILQYGGSLKRAAEDFLRVAKECDSYNEFKERYIIWDFGQNHYSLEGSDYTHDNFVYRNMDANGYERMKAALATYLKYGEKAIDSEIADAIVANVEAEILNRNTQLGNGTSL